MASNYLSKMPIGQAKKIVKNLIRTQSGKKISDTKFKEFLKKNDDLSKYAYKKDSGHLTKHQTKKFFDSVVKKASTNTDLKISNVDQKKMGIRVNKSGAVSDIGLDKMYTQAAQAELAAQEPSGPTPEEVRREKRRETAVKTFHKHERAREIEQEQKQQTNNEDKQSDSQPNRTVPRMSMRKNAGAANTGQPSNSTATATPIQTQSNTATDDRPTTGLPRALPLLIFPTENKNSNQPHMQELANRINDMIQRTMQATPLFTVMPSSTLEQSVSELTMRALPTHEDTDALQRVAAQAHAAVYIYGWIEQDQYSTTITIKMANTVNGKTVLLANVKEPVTDFFSLLRRIEWEIKHAFSGNSGHDSTDMPSASEAIDLPI